MAHKQIIALAVGGLAVLGSIAALGMAPANAATSLPTEVEVTIGGHCALSGGISDATIDLTGSGNAIQNEAAVAWSITCNQAGTLDWIAATDTTGTAATGNVLTTAGMGTGTGFAGLGAAAALTGNVWGATFTSAAGTGISGLALVGQAASTTAGVAGNFTAPTNSATTVANFPAGVVAGTVTHTYGAATDGTLPAGTYSGYVVYSVTPTP